MLNNKDSEINNGVTQWIDLSCFVARDVVRSGFGYKSSSRPWKQKKSNMNEWMRDLFHIMHENKHDKEQQRAGHINIYKQLLYNYPI